MAKLTGGGFTNLPADKTTLEDKLAQGGGRLRARGREPVGRPLSVHARGLRERRDPRNLPDLRRGRHRPAILQLSHLDADPEERGAGADLPQPDAVAVHRPRRIVRSRRPVPPSARARRRAGHAARPLALSVHQAAPAALRRPGARRAARSDGPGRQLALLGRAGRALLRHDLPRGRRVQRRPRHAVHRRSDAQDADLCGHAARERASGDGPAASDRAGGAEDAGGGRLHLGLLHRHFRRRPDRHRADRPDPHACARPNG